MSRPFVSILLAAAAFACTLPAQLTPPSFTKFGDGCVSSGNIVYELFPADAVLDLDGASLTFIRNGSGSYVVLPSSELALPFGAASPTAIDIQPQDDTVQQRTLVTMQVPYSGASGAASTSDLWVAPNGHVYLESSADPRCCTGSQALVRMLDAAAAPAFSIFGCDIDASFGSSFGRGTIWFDEQTVGGQQVCVVTWDGVNEFGRTPAASHTFQMQLFDDGTVHFVYVQTAAPRSDVVVGWSAGAGQPDVGAADLSGGPIDLGSGAPFLPLSIRAGIEPVEGQQLVVVLENLSPGAALATINLGVTRTSTPLTLFGSPDCTLYVLPDIFSSGVAIDPVSRTATLALGPLPTDSGGASFAVQGIALDPTSPTRLGVLTSDRGEVVVGDEFDFESGVVFQARGDDSYNSDVTSGFWSLRHGDPTRSGLTITRMVLDASPTAQNFDIDQLGMVDRFDGGDQVIAGCRNTYRNASAATTGLTFAGTDGSGCNPAATGTGFVATNPTGGPGIFRTLSFDFTDFQFGEVFEFDADTDGVGMGVSGDAMAGIAVTITFSDGSQTSGVLQALRAGVAGVIL